MINYKGKEIKNFILIEMKEDGVAISMEHVSVQNVLESTIALKKTTLELRMEEVEKP